MHTYATGSKVGPFTVRATQVPAQARQAITDLRAAVLCLDEHNVPEHHPMVFLLAQEVGAHELADIAYESSVATIPAWGPGSQREERVLLLEAAAAVHRVEPAKTLAAIADWIVRWRYELLPLWKEQTPSAPTAWVDTFRLDGDLVWSILEKTSML